MIPARECYTSVTGHCFTDELESFTYWKLTSLPLCELIEYNSYTFLIPSEMLENFCCPETFFMSLITK